MVTYNKKEIKKAILKTLPVGTAVCLSNWETIKWQMILNDGFKKRGFLDGHLLLTAIGEMQQRGYFERHRDPVTKERIYTRIQ